jgi:aspartate/methionine/tyrosine aminotransferase
MTDGSDSVLTKAELAILDQPILDLGVGYPEISLPDWLHHLWHDAPLSELISLLKQRVPGVVDLPFQSLPSPVALEREFVAEALRVLGISETAAGRAYATSSGSTALWCAISASVPIGGHVLAQTPIFDVIRGFLAERDALVTYVSLDWDTGRFDLSTLIDGPPVDAIVLVSPDNPSGAVLDQDSIDAFLEARGVTTETAVILDQSFLLLAERELRIRALGTTLLEGHPNWIVVWDTGKTFDLDDEKLGLIVASQALRPTVKAKLDLLQCTLPRRTLIQLTLILERARATGYLDWLWGLRTQNATLLKDFAVSHGLAVLENGAGAFLLLGRWEDVDALCAEARRLGLGLLGTGSFLSPSRVGDSRDEFIRVPLIRDPEMIAASLQILDELITRQPPKPPSS